MTELPFNNSMHNKTSGRIHIRGCNRLSDGKFPPSGTGDVPRRIRLVSEHTNNWKYFEYAYRTHKKRTPGGVLPVDYYVYYSVDMDKWLHCYP